MNNIQPLHCSLKNIEDISVRISNILKKNNIPLSYEDDTALETIVNFWGGTIAYVSKESEKASVIHINSENEFTIYLSNNNGFLNNRFITAHELGHFVLHYILQGIDGELIAGLSAEYSQVESEANNFAAAFLIPAEKAKSKYAEIEKVCNPEDKLGIIQKTAAFFSVSIDTMIKRWDTISNI